MQDGLLELLELLLDAPASGRQHTAV